MCRPECAHPVTQTATDPTDTVLRTCPDQQPGPISNGNGEPDMGMQPPDDDDTEQVEAQCAGATSLSDEFWQSRPFLSKLRQAARARLVSPEAMLGVALAHAAAFVPPSLCVPAFIGGTAPLSLFVALIAGTGEGKTATAKASREFIPLSHPDVVGPLPLGSGEGMSDAYCEMTVINDDGKKVRRKVQTKRGALFELDEGRILAEMSSRKGSTIMPTLCSAWIGGDLGQANASAETSRHVVAGTYSAGLISLWQPTRAEGLFGDIDGGAPGRFLYLRTADLHMPVVPPAWPGSMQWTLPAETTVAGQVAHQPLTYPQSVVDEVLAHHRAKVRREVVVGPLDGHRNLHKLKIAGLLALLDDRTDVTVEDWNLAETIVRYSDATRATVLECIQADATRKEREHIAKAIRRDNAVKDNAEHRVLRSAAATVGRRARRNGDVRVPKRDLVNAISSKHRRIIDVDEVFLYAVEKGWIVADGDNSYRMGPEEPPPASVGM
jgi:hypothetical protein